MYNIQLHHARMFHSAHKVVSSICNPSLKSNCVKAYVFFMRARLVAAPVALFYDTWILIFFKYL